MLKKKTTQDERKPAQINLRVNLKPYNIKN